MQRKTEFILVVILTAFFLVSAQLAFAKSAQEWGREGIMAFRSGNDVEAIRCYQKAIEIDPNYHQAYGLMGTSYGRQGKRQEAIAAASTAIDLAPKDAKVVGAYYEIIGRCYFSLGKLRQAEQAYEKSLSYTPDHPRRLNKLQQIKDRLEPPPDED